MAFDKMNAHLARSYPMIRIFLLFCCCYFLNAAHGVSQMHSWQTYNRHQVRKQVHKIASRMEKGGGIDDFAVGFSGTQTEQYDRFLRLMQIARTEELVALTGHPAPAVRGYAFWALVERKYPGLEIIYKAHADDKEKVLFTQGCIPLELPMPVFMCWMMYEQQDLSRCY